MVLIGGTALIVFGFSNDLSEAKQVYLTAEVTSNTAEPLTLHLWRLDKKAELKDLVVSVKTPTGISTGTLDPAHEPFFEGQIIPIGFETGFPKGSYLITVTGIFADGTTQVLFTKTMNVEAEGQTILEVSGQKLFLEVKCDIWKSRNITLNDTTTYLDINIIDHWMIDYGYAGTPTQKLYERINQIQYRYPPEAFGVLLEKDFVITYTAYYKDGKTKTTVQKKIKIFKEITDDKIVKYLSNYKIGGESLVGTGDIGHHIDLIGTLSAEVWRTDISGRIIKIVGVEHPALQINLNSKAEAASIKFTCDTKFRVGGSNSGGGTHYNSGDTYQGGFSKIYLNTAGTSSININLKVYNAADEKLAEQTTQIIIRD